MNSRQCQKLANIRRLAYSLVLPSSACAVAGMWSAHAAASPVFELDASLYASSGRDVALGDIDHDGDLDALVAAADWPPATDEVWFNNGGGKFIIDPSQYFNNSTTREIELGDVDGDGDLDVVVQNIGGNTGVFLNDGTGRYQIVTSMHAWSKWDVELGDLDGDGDLDAVSVGVNATNTDIHGAITVWLNQGDGTLFEHNGQTLDLQGYYTGVDLGDLDGDGDLDAFAVGYNGPAKVWLNDGNAHFNDSGQMLGNDESRKVALADLDGDGDLDAFAVTLAADRVWVNDGSATFVDNGQALSSGASNSVALGDLDGDGDLDAVVATANGLPSLIWLNDGSAQFATSGLSLGTADATGVELGDVDGDGDLDAFIVTGSRQPDQIWLNQTPSCGDSDGDGVCDSEDICYGNDTAGDSDQDGVCDDGDLCEGDDGAGDIDGDMYCSDTDNCPTIPNPLQEDGDGDGIGDACEADSDMDGVIDDNDNCPTLANNPQHDLDQDGEGDACDEDIDGDNVSNSVDNCPVTANPDQNNFDNDEFGDACDGDADGDGVIDEADNCANSSLGVPVDNVGCSGEQWVFLSCGSPEDYSNRGEYVSCVSHASKDAEAATLLTKQERALLIRRSAH